METIFSVRGEANGVVAPDSAGLGCVVHLVRDSQPEALRDAAAAVQDLIEMLRALGGSALTVENRRADLTWSTESTVTHDKFKINPETKRRRRTGQVEATVRIKVTVREFALLDDVAGAVATCAEARLSGVSWQVDADNPAWRSLRADAVRAALQRGQDYAGALGGAVERVLHVADLGLLGDESGVSGVPFGGRAAGATLGMQSAEGAVPSLDPVPQELFARIEARFAGTVTTVE